nr:TraR/DksA family transcriptional regulator [Gammaproteobacteria bacterium]
MTDLSEMAEALELARVAADPVDRAGGMVEVERLSGIAVVRAQMQGDGQDDCEDCGCQIPAARRAAAPWAIRCAPCQEVEDQKGRHRRG